jgi:hypothetical protein
VVNANALLLQTEDIGASEVIDEKKMQELPQNGHNAFSLALLAPDMGLADHTSVGRVGKAKAESSARTVQEALAV